MIIIELKEDLGQFSNAHFDSNDHPAYMTVMLSLPTGQHGGNTGYFHILQLGVYMKLKLYRGLVFSGHRKHVGTALAASGGSEDDGRTVFHINTVFYPTKYCVDGQGRYLMGPMY